MGANLDDFLAHAKSIDWYHAGPHQGLTDLLQNGMKEPRLQTPGLPSVVDNLPRLGAFGAGIIDILDAGSTTKYKTVRTLTGVTASAPVGVHLTSGLVMTTSAITSLNITHLGSGIATGSRFSLYGVKG